MNWTLFLAASIVLVTGKYIKSKSTIRDGIYAVCENDDGSLYHYKQMDLGQDYCDKRVITADYKNKINSTGWAFFDVKVHHENIPHHLQGYLAGFLEGVATRDLIDFHIQNTVDGYCDEAEDYCDRLNKYLLDNYIWMLKEIQRYPRDPYWKQVNLTLNQVVGMINGYEGSISGSLSVKEIVAHPIFMIQLAGDLEDLAAKFRKPENPHRIKTGRGRCSALVKLLPKNADLLFSHVTWSSYSSMLRMQKKYTFKTGDVGESYSFSSYPGSVASVDDFILTSAKLAIFETTIGNYNEDLYQYMTPQSVLCFIRSQVAHRTANSGVEWAHQFAKHNSGTYNNQWVVVDYKLFNKHSRVQPSHGLIHVLEQMPKHIVHADQTKRLVDTSFWPSYNCPFYPQIFKWSDAPKMVEKYGDWYSYDKTPRALIFARDHKNVKCMKSMTHLMRSNNYTQDPLSRCACDPPYSAENAISCRSELNPEDGEYPFESLGFRDHGATDMKLTNSELIESLSFSAIAGPTHDPTPVFDWTTAPFDEKVPHYGQPDRWEFKPIIHKWGR